MEPNLTAAADTSSPHCDSSPSSFKQIETRAFQRIRQLGQQLLLAADVIPALTSPSPDHGGNFGEGDDSSEMQEQGQNHSWRVDTQQANYCRHYTLSPCASFFDLAMPFDNSAFCDVSHSLALYFLRTLPRSVF